MKRGRDRPTSYNSDCNTVCTWRPNMISTLTLIWVSCPPPPSIIRWRLWCKRFGIYLNITDEWTGLDNFIVIIYLIAIDLLRFLEFFAFSLKRADVNFSTFFSRLFNIFYLFFLITSSSTMFFRRSVDNAQSRMSVWCCNLLHIRVVDLIPVLSEADYCINSACCDAPLLCRQAKILSW